MEMDSSAGGVAVVAMDAIGVCVCVLCHSSTTTVALLIITIWYTVRVPQVYQV